MKRAEVTEKFQEKCSTEAEEVKRKFIEILSESMDRVMEQIDEAFKQIRQQAEKKEKAVCMHFVFSLLRYELMRGRALVRLDVSDAGWVLDEEPLYAELDVTFLFRPFFEWKEQLLLDIREFMGKVNRYDVEYLVQEEIMQSSALLIYALRFAFRDIESQEAFGGIPKLSFWSIRFGEYKDSGEIIVQVNRGRRSEEEWKERLKETKDKPELMQSGWWYRSTFREGDCKSKKMCFTVFEECMLENIDFSKADLAGARFLNCHLKGCSFTGAKLMLAEYRQCVLEDCDFTETDLNMALFTPEGLKAEWFDEKQQDEMLVILPEGYEIKETVESEGSKG